MWGVGGTFLSLGCGFQQKRDVELRNCLPNFFPVGSQSWGSWGTAHQGAHKWGRDTERQINEYGAARRILACSLPAFLLLTCPWVMWVTTQQEAVSSWLHMNPEALSSRLAFLGRGGETIFGVEVVFRECLQGSDLS